MALTEFQKMILKIISTHRKERGESYIAGGLALNTLLKEQRLSRDIDIFHDTREALISSYDEDKIVLTENDISVDEVRMNPSYIEAWIYQKNEKTLVQWTRDSAYRFFPLIEDAVLGLTLHPFDLAINKVLAFAGRLEPRDWIDTIACHTKLQHLAYLIWAACGKDPGINPEMVLEDASRLHYSKEEIAQLSFLKDCPDVSELNRVWKTIINESDERMRLLPEEHIGKALLTPDGNLYNKNQAEFEVDISDNTIFYHTGSIGGSWPEILE